MQIAQTIIAQLGGTGRLSAMINARDFVALEDGVMFRFSGNRKINKIRIRLNSLDLYDVEFLKVKKFDFTVTASESNVYAEDLKKIIEQEIKLYLSL